MAESEVCPTMDAIRAFLEHLVDPLLQQKLSISDDPSLSLQQKVAKQVHSVVLLYNYYHKKQNPELEFVAFKEFCKLIVDLRPALLPYMKFTQKPVEADLVDVEQQLSLTEKAIMSSYDICTLLDASKKVPNIEGWPVSKVAILLVDSKKENCFLRCCSITDGAWSLIEKDVDGSNQISEATSEIKTYKKRRVIKKPSNDGLNEGQILRVGYSVTKEAAGVNTIDILLLKSYTVYSQSKEKTASRFYIMKCSQPVNEGFIQIPIKDLVERFRGPLVQRSSSSWKVTPVVEYFHVLPYSEIISDWISRETFSNSLQDSKLEEKQFPKLEVTESHVSKDGTSIALDNKPCSDTIVALNQKENNGCSTIIQCGSIKEDQDMDADNSLVSPSKNKEECQEHIAKSHVSTDGMFIDLDNKPCSDTIVALNQKENDDCGTIIRCGSIKEDQVMDAGNSLVSPSKDTEECQEHIAKSHVSTDGMSIDLDNKPCSDTIVALNQKENNDCGTIIRFGSIKEDQDMDAGNSLVSPSKDKEECQKHVAESLVSSDAMSNGLDNKPCSDDTIVALNQKENNDCGTFIRCGSIKEDHIMDAGNSLVSPSKDKEECQKHIAESLVSSDVMSNGLDNKPCSDDTIVGLNQKENNACSTIIRCGSIKEDRDMDSDNSLVFASKNKEECQKHIARSHVSNDGMSIGLDNKPCSDTIVALNQKENNDCGTIISCGSIKEDQDMDAGNSLVFPSKYQEECQKHIAESLVSSDIMFNCLDSKSCSDDTIVALNQKENNVCGTNIRCGSIKEDQDMDADNSSVLPSKNKEEWQEHIAESLVSSDAMANGLDNKPCSDDTIVALNQKENNGCGTIVRCVSIKEDQDMDAENYLVFPSKNQEECQKHIAESHVNSDDKPCSDTIVALNQKENNDCGTIIRCGSIKEDQDIDADNSLVFASKNKEECQKHIAESLVSSNVMSNGLDSKPCSDDTIVALNQEENNACGTIIRCGSIKEDQDMDADNSLVFPSKNKEECQEHIAQSHVCSDDTSIGHDNKPCSDNIVALNQKENNGCGTIVRCVSIKEDQDMDAENSLVFPSKNQEECQKHNAESHVSSDDKPCSDTIVGLNQKENNGCGTVIQCGSIKEDQDMDVDNKEDFQTHIADTLQVNEDQMIENPMVQLHSNECTRPSEVEKVVSARMQITEGVIKDQSAFDKILTNATLENESLEKCTLIANNSNTDLEKVQIFIASNEKMGLSDVYPSVDAVRAFLEHLVDPMLPAKPSIRDDPPLSQQLKLAKQVHSVVLLYNYYHRKQHPELEFVAFKDFCKLIVDLRPVLSRYMKFTQKPDETDLVDMEQQLSLTEKAIIGSCNICTHLDASKSVPNIEGWPVSKVAVLLVNSKKENCFLLFCSITDGVWSVIEKDVDSYNQISEVTNGINHAYKKRRVIKKPTENGSNVDDDEFVQVGYSAVKEATGINSIDIMLLESYTVYSQSKEKTASRFYIMKCSQPTTEGLIQVPIKDLIESFRGPLLKKSSSSWAVTSVLEYFHVLPYSEIISEWISRVTFSNSLQDSKLVEKQSQKHDVTEPYASSEGMSVGIDNKSCHDTIEALNQKEMNDCNTITRRGSVKEGQDMDVDNSSDFPSKNKEECKRSVKTLQVSKDQKVENPSVQHHSNECTSSIQAEKVVSTRKHITEGGIKDQSAFDKICANTTFENESVEKCTLIGNNSNIDLEKIGIFIASKGKILSQTAVNALKRKRNTLALQKRVIEDEIAVCNMKIQKWLIGEEDDMDLKIDSIIEGCNGTWLRNQGRRCQYLEGQCLPPSVKSKRLTEAVLTLQSPCEELDEICHENNWITPTYGVSPSNGAFQANVSVKGVDFEYLCEGNPCSFPREARDSAAAQMLNKLRSMAKSAL